MTSPDEDLIREARELGYQSEDADRRQEIVYELADALERSNARWEELAARVLLSGRTDAEWFQQQMDAIEAKYSAEAMES